MKHLVLLSGGMDSATALTRALNRPDAEEVAAFIVNYGSQHSQAEIRAANEIAYVMGAEAFEFELPSSLFKGGTSALMGDSEIPSEEYHDPEKESPSATVVPFRNANLISAAVAFAEGHNFDRVWVAVHATDARGFAYPDCTPPFMGAMAAAVYVGTGRKVQLEVPFQWMTKAQIVKEAAKYKAPLHLTWSCYRGGTVHCGLCPTCKERLNAFRIAGYIDPVEYQGSDFEWPRDCKEFPYV